MWQNKTVTIGFLVIAFRHEKPACCAFFVICCCSIYSYCRNIHSPEKVRQDGDFLSCGHSSDTFRQLWPPNRWHIFAFSKHQSFITTHFALSHLVNCIFRKDFSEQEAADMKVAAPHQPDNNDLDMLLQDLSGDLAVPVQALWVEPSSFHTEHLLGKGIVRHKHFNSTIHPCFYTSGFCALQCEEYTTRPRVASSGNFGTVWSAQFQKDAGRGQVRMLKVAVKKMNGTSEQILFSHSKHKFALLKQTTSQLVNLDLPFGHYCSCIHPEVECWKRVDWWQQAEATVFQGAK